MSPTPRDGDATDSSGCVSRRRVVAGTAATVGGALAGCLDGGTADVLPFTDSHVSGDADVPTGLLDATQVRYPDGSDDVDAEIHEYHDGYHLDYLDPEHRFWVRPIGVDDLGGNPLTRDLSGDEPAAWFAPTYGGGIEPWNLYLLANEAFLDAIDGGQAYYGTIGDGPDEWGTIGDSTRWDPVLDDGFEAVWRDAGDGCYQLRWPFRDDRVLVVADDVRSLTGTAEPAMSDPAGVFIEGSLHEDSLDPTPPEPPHEAETPEVSFEYDHDEVAGELAVTYLGGDEEHDPPRGLIAIHVVEERWSRAEPELLDGSRGEFEEGETRRYDVGDAEEVGVVVDRSEPPLDVEIFAEDPYDGDPDVSFEYAPYDEASGAGIEVVHAGGDELPRGRIFVVDSYNGFVMQPIDPFPERVTEGDAAVFETGVVEFGNVFQVVYEGEETRKVFDPIHVPTHPLYLWEEPTIAPDGNSSN